MPILVDNIPKLSEPWEVMPSLRGHNLPRIENLREDFRYSGESVGKPWETCFASTLFERLQSDLEFADILDGDENPCAKTFKDLPPNEIIIDLAAGENHYGYLIANLLNAAGYIGLDAYHYLGTLYALSQSALILDLSALEDPIGLEKKLIPRAVVPEDMLTLLRRLPDRSASIFALGLHNVLSWPYFEEVNKEISRVVSDNGFILSYPLSSSALHLEGSCFYEFSCAHVALRERSS